VSKFTSWDTNHNPKENHSAMSDDMMISMFESKPFKNKGFMNSADALDNLKKYRETKEEKYRDAILVGNLKLLYHLSVKCWTPGFQLSDLFQEACIGFIDGIEKYDETKAVTKDGKAKISSYSYFYAKKYILAYIEANFNSIKFTRRPLRASQKIKKLIENAVKELEVNESIIPYDHLLQNASKMELRGALEISKPQMSLSRSISDSENSDIYLEDTISDKNEAENRINFDLNLDIVYDMITSLNRKSERLLLSKFHLIDEDFIYVCFEYGMGEYEGNLFIEDLISHLRKSLK
jgi:DNA-directed RNA polymerase sigma subunit (sigma70/sigma32)